MTGIDGNPLLSSQCGVCGTALTGPLGFLFRVVGIRRSPRNPNVCSRCNTHIEEGKVVEVTVMFADLSSFTELTQELGAVRTHAVVDAFLKMVTEVLVKNGATIDKYVGDAAMAWFNVPIKTADHAARAVKGGLELQSRMPELREKFKMPLEAGVGIASGWAYLGRLGSSDKKDFTVIGDAVNLAARLEGKAAAGQIVMGAGVYEAIKRDFPDVVEERLNLKGFSEPVPVYRLGSGDVPAPVNESRGVNASKPIRLGAIIFAVLGAPCAVASLIGPLALILGAGWLFSVIGALGFIDDHPLLRFPILALASAGAAANLYTVRHAAALRRQMEESGRFVPVTKLEKRETVVLKLFSYATFFIVALELVLHFYLHGSMM